MNVTGPPEQNVTTGPTTITVAAVVYDRIVINIPDAFVSMVAEIEAQIEQQQTPPNSTPITFMVRVISHRQQQTITIPPEDISAIEKESTYILKVS